MWNSIITQQLELAYYGNIPPAHSDEMAVFERIAMYEKLRDTKLKEKEALEEERRKAKIKSKYA